MTREEAVKQLKAAAKESDHDQESGHIAADLVLAEFLFDLGYGDVIVEFNRVAKWYA